MMINKLKHKIHYPRKLSSKSIVLLTFLNTLLPLFSLTLARAILNYQTSKGFIDAITLQNFEKTLFLVLIFLALLILILDILLLINPFYRLETMIRRYNIDKGDKTLPEYQTPDSALAELFQELLNAQKTSMAHLYESEVLRQQTELMALQSQINPHFLYNTLDSIRGLALLNEVKEIADMAEALSRLFRSMVSKEGQLISLSEELISIQSYMTIQQFRFNNRFVFINNINDPFLLSCQMPNLLLQPIVENAIVHGLDDINGAGYVAISAYATQYRLVISIEDNGCGIKPEKLDEINQSLQNDSSTLQKESKEKADNGTGIALQNINKRIRLQFGNPYGLSIMSTENIGTVIELTLPLIEDEKNESIQH